MILLVGGAADDSINQDDIKDIIIAGSIWGSNVSVVDYEKKIDYNDF